MSIGLTRANERRPAGENLLLGAGLILIAAVCFATWPGLGQINRDTIWLAEIAEQMLDGKSLYGDIIETNPPMSVLLYMPAVLAARLLGVQAESAVAIYTLLCALLVTGLCWLIVRADGWFTRREGWMAIAGIAALFILFPKQIFTQREHLAGMAALPFVLLLMARHEARPLPSLSIRIAAGLAAGLCICIKPHFALAIAFPVLVSMAVRRRPALAFTTESVCAALTVLAYAASLWLIFPDYARNVLPLVNDVYVPSRIPLFEYLVSPLTLIFLVFPLLTACLLPRFSDNPRPWLLMAAAAGFFLAYLVQGKGWAYHLYPAVLFVALAALFSVLPERAAGRVTRVWRKLALVLLFAGLAYFFSGGPPDFARLRTALSSLPKRAPVLIVTPDLTVSFPVVRDLQLSWSSRTCSQWLGGLASNQLLNGEPDAGARVTLQTAVDLERRWLAEDIERHRPEMIVFDLATVIDWERFALDDPRLASLLAGYQRGDVFDDAGGYRFVGYQRVTEAQVSLIASAGPRQSRPTTWTIRK